MRIHEKVPPRAKTGNQICGFDTGLFGQLDVDEWNHHSLTLMRVRILAWLALCGALIASGQTTNLPVNRRSISLRECFDLALRQNVDLQIEHISAGIAHNNLTGAYGAYIPTFTFGYKRALDNESAGVDWKKQNPYLPFELYTDTTVSELNGRLPFGLSYDFGTTIYNNNGRTDFSSNPDQAIDYPNGIRQTNEYSAQTAVTLRQHLLKDFWIDQDRSTLLIRRKELKISQQALRFEIMKTVLGVELGYYDLIAAREQIRVEEKALELRQQLLNETKRRVQVGDLPPLDTDQAETQLQTTLTALTAAREAFVTRGNILKSVLTDNFKEWAEVDLQPSEELLAIPQTYTRSESFSRALKNRPDLEEARLAIEKNEVAIKFRKNQLFPNLDLIGRYGSSGSQPDFGTAMSDTFHYRYPDYFYGVVVSFPLSNLKERADYRNSQAFKKIAELQLKKAEQEVLLQVADFVNRLQSRFSQVTSTRKARTYAEAALGAEQKKLQNGLSTTFIVLQLQETLTSAQTAEILALAEYNKVLAQLAFAEGTTLERHHLTIELN
jgi:outer membrane protein TolC